MPFKNKYLLIIISLLIIILNLEKIIKVFNLWYYLITLFFSGNNSITGQFSFGLLDILLSVIILVTILGIAAISKNSFLLKKVSAGSAAIIILSFFSLFLFYLQAVLPIIIIILRLQGYFPLFLK